MVVPVEYLVEYEIGSPKADRAARDTYSYQLAKLKPVHLDVKKTSQRVRRNRRPNSGFYGSAALPPVSLVESLQSRLACTSPET